MDQAVDGDVLGEREVAVDEGVAAEIVDAVADHVDDAPGGRERRLPQPPPADAQRQRDVGLRLVPGCGAYLLVVYLDVSDGRGILELGRPDVWVMVGSDV